jgi:hypothetical protein
MLKNYTRALALATIAALPLVLNAPATADDKMMSGDKMMMTKIDCTQAGSMMSSAAKMGSAPAMMSGDTDEDFMAMMMDREKGTNKLLKIESQCGKNDKMKAMAMKEADASDKRMEMFRNQGMSQ